MLSQYLLFIVMMYRHTHTHTRGDPPKPDFIHKNCIFILTCLNFSHLQSTLYLMQYNYRESFPLCKTGFWTHQLWSLLVLLPFFYVLLYHCHTGKTFPSEDFFIPGQKKKKVTQGNVGWTVRVEHRDQAVFG